MLRLRVTYADDSELRLAIEQEIARGVLLVKGTPPEGIEFRQRVAVDIGAPGGALALETEVASILPGVGVAVAFPADRVADARALLDAAPPADGSGAGGSRASNAEKMQIALHGTRDDRAAILRDQNRALHAYVLKNPQVTVEEVTEWAKNAQMSAEFLKLIGDRKEWITRPAVATALARNPKTPATLAVRALDAVPLEALRQMAKGVGVPPHVVTAARKKIITP